ncbi:hypothetical protein GH146_02240 [archaeon]|nr:hypothetical protein [archaeon]
MSEDILAKTLSVISINPTTELATGDMIYQVVFGEYIDITQELLSRLPPTAVQRSALGNKIGIAHLILFLKKTEIPYTIGSTWTITVNGDGALNLVKAQ